MDLIVVACLLASPAECREHRVNLSLEPGDTVSCIMTSAPIVAEWSVAHPKWRLRSWRCENDDGSERV